jgi:hypothetical protein
MLFTGMFAFTIPIMIFIKKFLGELNKPTIVFQGLGNP